MKGPIAMGALLLGISLFMGKGAVTPGEETAALAGIGVGLGLMIFGIVRLALRGARWSRGNG